MIHRIEWNPEIVALRRLVHSQSQVVPSEWIEDEYDLQSIHFGIRDEMGQLVAADRMTYFPELRDWRHAALVPQLQNSRQLVYYARAVVQPNLQKKGLGREMLSSIQERAATICPRAVVYAIWHETMATRASHLAGMPYSGPVDLETFPALPRGSRTVTWYVPPSPGSGS